MDATKIVYAISGGFLDYIIYIFVRKSYEYVVYMYMSVCRVGCTPLLYLVLYVTFFIVSSGA